MIRQYGSILLKLFKYAPLANLSELFEFLHCHFTATPFARSSADTPAVNADVIASYTGTAANRFPDIASKTAALNGISEVV